MIPRSNISYEKLHTEFLETNISFISFNENFCVYYKDRCIVDGKGDFQLTQNEQRHFINSLKRVSDEIYESYQDNMDVHCIKKKIMIKKK
jgi:hypothetical protein